MKHQRCFPVAGSLWVFGVVTAKIYLMEINNGIISSLQMLGQTEPELTGACRF
jgi:hypothetical protein